MDYYLLTDLAAQVGHGLAISGAETFRVEDTIRRILRAYGIECEVFAIPNCLTISFEAANGKPLTIMKRIGFHGNDLDAVEQFNALSRRICRETPEVEVAVQWLEETGRAACRKYSLPVYYLGHYLGAFGFCFVFGGTLRDSLWAGLLGLSSVLSTGFEPAGGEPLLSHHRRLLLHGGSGISGGQSGVDGFCGLFYHRRTDDPGAGAAHHQLHAGYHLRRYQLRYQPHRAGAAVGLRHCTGYGGSVAHHLRAVRPAGKHRCGASLLGAGSGGAGGLRGLRHPLQRTRRRNVAVYAGRAWPRGWYTCWRSSWAMVFTA